MNICPQCGHLLDDDDMFCSKCGSRVGGHDSATPPPLPYGQEYQPHCAPGPQPVQPQQSFRAPQHRPIEPEPLRSHGQRFNAGALLLILLVLAAVGLVAYLLIPHGPANDALQPQEVVATSGSADSPFEAADAPDVAESANDGLSVVHTGALLPNTVGSEPATAAKSMSEAKAYAEQRNESPSAYQETVTHEAPQQVFKSVEQMPWFPGGDAALMKYISSHLQYPSSAQDSHIEGTVVVQFVVTATGMVGEVKVVRSVDRDLDREAVRVCRSLPNFVPGRRNGQAVNVWYTLPIKFKLES